MRRVWLAALAFMLLLAACAHPRPAGEGQGESGSASLPAATPLPPTTTRPPATPTPMPTPTPGPEALAGEIYPYLNHYLGRPEATFVSDKTLWGTTRLSPPDNHLFAAYGIVQDGADKYVRNKYVIVSNGSEVDLVPIERIPTTVLDNLSELPMTTDEAREKVDKARAWFYFEKDFSLKPLEMTIAGLNGKTTTLDIDTKRFLEDWDYARGILETIYSPDFNVVYSHKAGGFIKNPSRSEANHLKDLWLGMRIIYYYTNFNPDFTLTGKMRDNDSVIGYHAVNGREFKKLRIAHVGRIKFERPSIDSSGYTHTNIDIIVGDGEKYAVYNPFTPDVKPRAVRAFFWQGTDRDTLYGALLVRVTDPGTGKNLYFEFDHLTAAHRENGRWAPENELWREALKHNNWGWANNLNIPLEQGQLFGYVSDPKTDIYSNAYHVQFGQILSTKPWILGKYSGAVMNPYTAALQVYFMTHQADKYRGVWEEKPSGSGFWMGDRQAGS